MTDSMTDRSNTFVLHIHKQFEAVHYLDIINQYVLEHYHALDMVAPVVVSTTHPEYPTFLKITKDYIKAKPSNAVMHHMHYIRKTCIRDYVVYVTCYYDWTSLGTNESARARVKGPKGPIKKEPVISKRIVGKSLKKGDIKLNEQFLCRNVAKLADLTMRERQKFAEIQDAIHYTIYGDDERLFENSILTQDFIPKDSARRTTFIGELTKTVTSILKERRAPTPRFHRGINKGNAHLTDGMEIK